MMLSESLERGGPTGLFLHAIGKLEILLVPARVTRRLTGLQVMQVIVTRDRLQMHQVNAFIPPEETAASTISSKQFHQFYKFTAIFTINCIRRDLPDVFRKMLVRILTSLRPTKTAIVLEESDDARVLLTRAVECCRL
ncbi:hypothetical protein KIN20_015311 [Parelaphostrongylus tenuis]|uniref:Uncharacterized protein n=1 Tax=Parelaphostrongylus tenuis TaxID=148309 RepID=A0AAD5MJB7_PARTN|nr:hypothetical protein KIN20_015311 [Parelaphostrongylus tenuis]